MPLDLNNNTPFSCEQLPLTDKKGANILRIVLKAAYQLNDKGQLEIANEQPEIVMEDKYWGAPAESSVRYESDVSLEKPFTDLIVNGHAYAPHGRTVQQMEVALTYQRQFTKRLRVFGDRVWEKGVLGWHMTRPKFFEKMPIVYDRAFGGADEKGSEPRNRIGTGYATKISEEVKGMPVPNIELPNELINSPTDRPTPAGFGVVSKNWEPRLSFAGTYDEAWLENVFPLLPHDFDMRFNQSVMPDQWISRRPKGGEVIGIKGMTPDGVFQVKLPPCEMNIALHYSDHKDGRMMDLDAVLIEPDEKKIMLTWRAMADIHGDPFRLEETIISASQS